MSPMRDAPQKREGAEPADPSTWTQEQLMNFMQHVLSQHRTTHKPGTRERDGYEAALGLVMQHDKRRGWWTRFKWGWWKRIHERRMIKKAGPA